MKEPKPKRGAKPILIQGINPVLIDDAIAMTEAGIPQSVVARHLGVAAGWCSQHRKEILDDAKHIAKGRVIGTAYQMAISGECPALTIFYLKTRCGWREERETDGSPMPTLGSVDVS